MLNPIIHKYISINGWVITFCEKIQNGSRRHPEWTLHNFGPPTVRLFPGSCVSNFVLIAFVFLEILQF